jgi:hypothetical protein
VVLVIERLRLRVLLVKGVRIDCRHAARCSRRPTEDARRVVIARQARLLGGDIGRLHLRLLRRRALVGTREASLGNAQALVELADRFLELLGVQAEGGVELAHRLVERLLVARRDRAEQAVDARGELLPAGARNRRRHGAPAATTTATRRRSAHLVLAVHPERAHAWRPAL